MTRLILAFIALAGTFTCLAQGTQLDWNALGKLSKPERIRFLVQHLDEVKATSGGNPGGPSFHDDPILKALVAEGGAAVEPLLEVIEFDHRAILTSDLGRSVGVKAIASEAVRRIIRFSSVINNHQKLAEFWSKYRKLSPEERWFEVLKDDSADVYQWLEAATRIVSPPEFDYLGPRASMSPTPTPAPGMGGAVLKKKANPSVNELLEKRSRQLLTRHRDSGTSEYWDDLGAAMDLARVRAKWKAEGSLLLLRDTSEAAMQKAVQDRQNSATDALARFQNNLLHTLRLRDKLGDSNALRGYSEWIPQITVLDESPGVIYGFLIEHSSDPVIKAIVSRVLDGLQLEKAAREQPTLAAQWLTSSLLVLPEMQAIARKVLDDRTVIGKAWRDHEDSFIKVGEDVEREYVRNLNADPLAPSDKIKTDLRVCDFLAHRLSNMSNAPKFRVYWPASERDKAIEKLRKFVLSYAKPKPRWEAR